MKNKEVYYGESSRENLAEGIKYLVDAVKATLGPSGRNVVIYDEGNLPISTKDGVTVAKSIKLAHRAKNAGVELIRQAAMRTADKAGDGTTTSTVLAGKMVEDGLTYLKNGKQINVTNLTREIKEATDIVVENIFYEDVTSEKQLKDIATISSNNDFHAGEIIHKALEKVGNDGAVHIEESRTMETYLENVEGIQFDRGYKSPHFVTDQGKMTSVLQNPYILLTDEPLRSIKDMLPILEKVSSDSRSILIIAKDIDGEALAGMVVNKMRGTLSVCAVKAPEFGDRMKLVLEDIAIITGGQVFSKEKGMQWETFNLDWLGEARVATIDRDTTTIVDGKGSEEKIGQRIEELQEQVDGSTSSYDRERLQDRLARFVGGVSIIHVGAYTEAALKEKKDRYEDALHATKAAIEEGIVPGGGVALLRASKFLDVDKMGHRVVINACAEPTRAILANSGFSDKEIEDLMNELILTEGFEGFDVKSLKSTDMKKAGVIDPKKVTRTALQNASSVARTILLTECVIVEDVIQVKEEESNPNPYDFMGG